MEPSTPSTPTTPSGQPNSSQPNPADAHVQPFANRHRSGVFPLLMVAFFLLIGGVGFLLNSVVDKPGPETSKSAVDTSVAKGKGEVVYLEAGADSAKNQGPPEMPAWMMGLILGFIGAQMLPVLLAAGRARKPQLTPMDLKAITFLCETPMYLGLLGSLVGVCLTQFTTGSLSAPMAYFTTIAGIVLYLVARLAILVPLPSVAATAEA